jgi:hypothetical protein
MCMSCSTGRITKKKIAIFSSIGVLIVVGTYFAFITTNNPAVAAAVPALLSFAACPAMCVAVGGIMWLSSRFSRNKNKDNNNTSISTTKEQESCCSGISDLNKKEQPQQRGIEVLESMNEKDRTSILQQKKQQVKFEN